MPSSTLTHLEPLDIFHPRCLHRLAHENDPKRRPTKKEDAESGGYKPVQRRQVIRPSKDYVERRRVKHENREACTGQNPPKVVDVSDNVFSEWVSELGFDRKNLAERKKKRKRKRVNL